MKIGKWTAAYQLGSENVSVISTIFFCYLQSPQLECSRVKYFSFTIQLHIAYFALFSDVSHLRYIPRFLKYFTQNPTRVFLITYSILTLEIIPIPIVINFTSLGSHRVHFFQQQQIKNTSLLVVLLIKKALCSPYAQTPCT